MCCCKTPNVNGKPGYSWDGRTESTYPVTAPELEEGETALWDEPGRCGGLDSHAFHFQLVKNGGQYWLVVRHGGGQERHKLSHSLCFVAVEHFSSNDRYWLLHGIYNTLRDAARQASEKKHREWMEAAAEKRIKRRSRGGVVRVTVEPKLHELA